MTRQSVTFHSIIPMAVLFAFMLTISGCGSSADLTSQINGKWKNEKGESMVDINLAKESSSLTIDGHTYKGVVEKIDKGNETVLVKVTTEGGSTEVWSIHQVWNDNGSAFKIKLRRNGTTETFIPVGHS